MMTLPRMLRRALQNQFNDPTLRLVHDLAEYRVERVAGDDRLILTLRTPDKFEVSFAISDEELSALAAAIDTDASRGLSQLM
ncbi:hypothetical protein [Peristeroidobacter soli]|uniref:hypothetical protein n=1 Tax=Peristeroidobacter soli TaxID=2497877 RepID=UPI00158E5874|nr:hypothetical protein [Peristeroidobacter soli]